MHRQVLGVQTSALEKCSCHLIQSIVCKTSKSNPSILFCEWLTEWPHHRSVKKDGSHWGIINMLIDDLDGLKGYPWWFCHLVGATYSFFGSIIDCTLKILPVAKILLWDGVKSVRDAAGTCCSMLGSCK